MIRRVPGREARDEYPPGPGLGPGPVASPQLSTFSLHSGGQQVQMSHQVSSLGYTGPGAQGAGPQGQGQSGQMTAGPVAQQQQQQHQQQQQQQPQQQAAGSSADAASNAPSNAQSGQEMNLANVLHYLQSEWRRWERDRNEWEIERAELRARIALLEGQRRSAENLKVDLLRRVKMLEFALRQERVKSTGSVRSTTTLGGTISGLSSVGTISGGTLVPSRLAVLQDEDKGRDDKEGSSSSEAGDDLAERLKTNGANGIHPAAMGKASLALRQDSTVWKNLGGGVPRDPKARARSREYLKQCLQEITYLTSPGALNPLNPRPPIALDDAAAAQPLPDRPLKVLPEEPAPLALVHEAPSAPPPAPAAQPPAPIQPAPAPSTPARTEPERQPEPPAPALPNGQPPPPPAPEIDPLAPPPAPVGQDAQPPSSPAPKTIGLPDSEAAETMQSLTAIYRPHSSSAWRENLKAAYEQAEKAKTERREPSDEEQLASLSLPEDDDADGAERHWATRRTLKSHLDIVRAVAFVPARAGTGPPAHVLLASAGADLTVKVWSLDGMALVSRAPGGSSDDAEPVATYRGHTAAITALAATPTNILSASLDSTIRAWAVPSPDRDPYAPHDATSARQVLEGHSDAVWDLALLPARPETAGQAARAPTLASASADGTVKFWADDGGAWKLVASWSSGDTPTCLATYEADLGAVLVGLKGGRVTAVDADGNEGLRFGIEASPVNAVLSHPTLPAVIVGYDNGQLALYDSKTGAATHVLQAHPGPLTALALSPLSPTHVLTASADTSARLWDLARRACVQDLTGHRSRAGEGVTHVAAHTDMPVLATAGADGVVRVWAIGRA
ncbi:1,2-dihydroxy-3-keto-5-methylthiopentene dioxygenase [Cryptotrichosporon argae]